MTLTLKNDSRNVLCRCRLKLRYFSMIIYLITPCIQDSLPIKLFFYCYLEKTLASNYHKLYREP